MHCSKILSGNTQYNTYIPNNTRTVDFRTSFICMHLSTLICTPKKSFVSESITTVHQFIRLPLFLIVVYTNTTGSKSNNKQQSTNHRHSLEKVVLKEIT